MNKTWIWILIILVLIGLGIAIYLSVFGEKTTSDVNESEAEGNVSEVIELPEEAVNESEADNVSEGSELEGNISESNDTQ